jgi:hypothetical protein
VARRVRWRRPPPGCSCSTPPPIQRLKMGVEEVEMTRKGNTFCAY